MPNITSFKSQEEYREWYRNYRSNNREKLKEYNKRYIKKWREINGTDNDKVRGVLRRAIKKGIIVRSQCEVCGANGAEGHHFNYSEPLKVIWLCPTHHKVFHKKLK